MSDTPRQAAAPPSKPPAPAWPFDEATRLVERLRASGKAEPLFETGYGPSGLPHIGTFGEVARTSWVRRAFTELTGRPSRLVAFSDDMDGLRKVPDNVPNRDVLATAIGLPLTEVPDPFGTHASFGAHNNARLRAFLDSFGFEYEFMSSTQAYRSGRFDDALRTVAVRHDAVVDLVRPTLGPERRATYSPFLPVHPRTGRVMQVRIDEVRADTVCWQEPDTGERMETSILGGACKLQWKADWAMRWHALGVDYEMSGKDLIDSVKLSSAICRVLGSEPPVSLTYELFLDEHAQKISKSKGNGLSIEEWLRYAPAESLAQFMFHAPQRAKRLFFGVIPRTVDEYNANLGKLAEQDEAHRHANPAWFIARGSDPWGSNAPASPIPFNMLLNLASVVNADTPDMLWGFIRRYLPDATPETAPALGDLVEHAVSYYRDFVRPAKKFRPATDVERDALLDLAGVLRTLRPGTDPEAIQDEVYAVGKRHPFLKLKDWFDCLYQVLLGQAEGPRFGGFVALYGIAETVRLIEDRLSYMPADAA